jgi:hypothetical protein
MNCSVVNRKHHVKLNVFNGNLQFQSCDKLLLIICRFTDSTLMGSMHVLVSYADV